MPPLKWSGRKPPKSVQERIWSAMQQRACFAHLVKAHRSAFGPQADSIAQAETRTHQSEAGELAAGILIPDAGPLVIDELDRAAMAAATGNAPLNHRLLGMAHEVGKGHAAITDDRQAEP